MKKETKIIIFLLFLSPALGELLSGSSPPLEFFNPIILLFLVLLYGCGTLLIREAKARWKLHWSVIFLAVAYGIVEEGIMIQSFFNTGHADLGILSGYGMYFGIMWPWTIMLILFHATMSTLIPIAIAESIWPEFKDVFLLKKRGLALAFAGIISITLFWIVFMVLPQGHLTYMDYYPNPLLLIGSFIVVMLLVWLAYKYRNSKISTNKISLFSPFVFGVFGFLFMAFILITPNFLAEAKVSAPITLLFQFIEIGLVLLFVFYQIYHQSITKRHIVSLIFGSILFFILFALLLGFVAGIFGMHAVGIISLILLVIWRHKVLS